MLIPTADAHAFQSSEGLPIILNEPATLVEDGADVVFQVSKGFGKLEPGIRSIGRLSAHGGPVHVCVVRVRFSDGWENAADGECLARGLMDLEGAVFRVDGGLLIGQGQKFFLYDTPASWREGAK